MDKTFRVLVDAGGDGVPAGDDTISDNYPDLPIVGGASGIARRWLGTAIWVAVVMTDDMMLTVADLAVGPHQGSGVNFECRCRMRADVPSGNNGNDQAGLAGQQPARFVRVCRLRLGTQRVEHPA